MADAVQSEINALFTPAERLTAEEFAAVPLHEKFGWHRTPHPDGRVLPLLHVRPDMELLLRDLDAVPREAAQDAYIAFADGAYHIMPEVPGTMLRTDAVQDAFAQFIAAQTLAADTPDARFELTDYDCYVPPQITASYAGFDFRDALAHDLADLQITVAFHGQAETLTPDMLASLLSAGADGRLSVDDAALDKLLSRWAEAYRAEDTPYLFSSYAGGVVPIDFLLCDYEVDTAALRNTLKRQLLSLESGDIAAPFHCFRDGEPFAVEDTYVEVDIKNQQLTYYKDGELIVHTDIVTGKLHGHRTPTGLYSSYDKQVNRWLVGEDYRVFVKYWVRITGHYGLHDASWRTKFGGDYYQYGGSHGCVNIPEDAMAVIYENIVDGTPILIH